MPSHYDMPPSIASALRWPSGLLESMAFAPPGSSMEQAFGLAAPVYSSVYDPLGPPTRNQRIQSLAPLPPGSVPDVEGIPSSALSLIPMILLGKRLYDRFQGEPSAEQEEAATQEPAPTQPADTSVVGPESPTTSTGFPDPVEPVPDPVPAPVITSPTPDPVPTTPTPTTGTYDPGVIAEGEGINIPIFNVPVTTRDPDKPREQPAPEEVFSPTPAPPQQEPTIVFPQGVPIISRPFIWNREDRGVGDDAGEITYGLEDILYKEQALDPLNTQPMDYQYSPDPNLQTVDSILSGTQASPARGAQAVPVGGGGSGYTGGSYGAMAPGGAQGWFTSGGGTPGGYIMGADGSMWYWGGNSPSIVPYGVSTAGA